MSYIGSQPADQTSGAKPRDEFVGTGSQTNFTLSQEVPGGFESAILVIVDNVLQQPIESYTIQNNNTLVFSEAPASGSFIYVLHQGNATYNMIPVTGSVTPDKLSDNLRNFTIDTFTGNGSTVDYTLTDTPASANAILVIVSGLVKTRTTDYTVSGSTLTFTSAPASSAPILVVHLGFSTVSRTGLVDGSVTTTKLADGSVTNGKLGVGAAIANIGVGGISANELGTGSVTAAKIASGQVIPASGIAFPATQSASSDANTLDDYEEGTWTPYFYGSSTAGTCSYNTSNTRGTYVKVGKVVTITFSVNPSSTHTGTGLLLIGGSPFSNWGYTWCGGTIGYWGGLTTALYTASCYMDGGSSAMICTGASSASGTIGYLNPTMVAAGTHIIGAITFTVD
jgi:hypothetical protein